jgi:hypothetical protein
LAAAVAVGLVLFIIGQVPICWRADIACGPIGEKRLFARPAITVAGVAVGLAAEQIITLQFLGGKLRRAAQHHVEL